MMDLLKKLLRLFHSPYEKIELLFIILLIFSGTIIEILSLGMVIPFIAVLNDPQLIKSNRILSHLNSVLGAESVNSFLIWMGLIVLIIFLLKDLYLVLLAYAQSKLFNRKYMQLSSRLFNTYLYSPYTFHLQKNTAQLLRNLSIVISIVQGIMVPLSVIVSEGMLAMLIFLVLLYAVPLPSIIVFSAFVIFMASFYYVIRKRMRQYGESLNYHSAMSLQNINQGLGSIKETKILGREKYFDDTYVYHIRQISRIYCRQQVISQLPKYYIEFITVLLILLAMAVSLVATSDSKTVLVWLSVFAVAAVRLMPSFTRISTSLSTVKFYIPCLDEVFSDLVTENTILEKNEDNKELQLNNEIALKNISYSYPGTDKETLKLISLKIGKNKTVGFVGHSGAGKTTVVDVILGLFPPSEGAVLVDGKDVANNLSSWQRIIGYVPQTIYLTDDTIRNNIAFGIPKEEIDDNRVKDVVGLSQLEDFIKGLPAGLDTVVGERGVRISGGERQRIGIARSLYHNPQVLIMDEATASLDNETERSFLEAVGKLTGSKTIIIIAHRLSTVRHCDKIFFLSGGRLLSEGTYEELLEQCPEFRKMADSSLTDDEDAK